MATDAKGQTVAAGDRVIIAAKVTSAGEDGGLTVETIGDDPTEVDLNGDEVIRANDGDDLGFAIDADGHLGPAATASSDAAAGDAPAK